MLKIKAHCTRNYQELQEKRDALENAKEVQEFQEDANVAYEYIVVGMCMVAGIVLLCCVILMCHLNRKGAYRQANSKREPVTDYYSS